MPPLCDNFVSGKIILLIMKMFAAHATPLIMKMFAAHATPFEASRVLRRWVTVLHLMSLAAETTVPCTVELRVQRWERT